MALLIKDKNLAITALPDKRKKDEESKTSIDRQSEVDEKKTKGKNSKTALLSVVLLLLGGLSIITYGQHMYNLRAIAHVEQAVQDINDIKPIDPKKLEQVEKLATKHNPQAEYAMGCYYMNGPEKDLDKAKDFFEKAVKDGNKDAQAKLDELKKTVETPESK